MSVADLKSAPEASPNTVNGLESKEGLFLVYLDITVDFYVSHCFLRKKMQITPKKVLPIVL